ncbi:MAG: hypothetical protein ACXVRI_13345 [Gaiellaceae bacterium]
MAVSELRDPDALAFRLVELEEQEAQVERRLARLLETQGRADDDGTERQIAGLRKEHLELRRQLNTVRARLVPIGLARR